MRVVELLQDELLVVTAISALEKSLYALFQNSWLSGMKLPEYRQWRSEEAAREEAQEEEDMEDEDEF